MFWVISPSGQANCFTYNFRAAFPWETCLTTRNGRFVLMKYFLNNPKSFSASAGARLVSCNCYAIDTDVGFWLKLRKPGFFCSLLCYWIWPNQALSLKLCICKWKGWNWRARNASVETNKKLDVRKIFFPFLMQLKCW